MKLWLLRPNEDRPRGDDPWNPWFNRCFGVVVRARTEKEARRIAHEQEGAQLGDAWLTDRHSTCVPMSHAGEPGVIISDLRNA